MKRLLKRAAVDVEAVLFASERCDGANGASSFASDLRRLFMRFLVVLVLEDNHTL